MADPVHNAQHDAEYKAAEYDVPRPTVFIRWKGTDACLDLYCVCGAQWHLDADFTYYSRCPACRQIYRLGCHVRMYPVADSSGALVVEGETV